MYVYIPLLNQKPRRVSPPRSSRAGGGRTHTKFPSGDFKTPGFVSIPYICVYLVSSVSDQGVKMSIVSIFSINSIQTAH